VCREYGKIWGPSRFFLGGRLNLGPSYDLEGPVPSPPGPSAEPPLISDTSDHSRRAVELTEERDIAVA